MEAIINFHDEEEILRSGLYERHHSALEKGYIGRKSDDISIIPYSGRFGNGFKVRRPNSISNSYYEVVYYTEIQ